MVRKAKTGHFGSTALGNPSSHKEVKQLTRHYFEQLSKLDNQMLTIYDSEQERNRKKIKSEFLDPKNKTKNTNPPFEKCCISTVDFQFNFSWFRLVTGAQKLLLETPSLSQYIDGSESSLPCNYCSNYFELFGDKSYGSILENISRMLSNTRSRGLFPPTVFWYTLSYQQIIWLYTLFSLLSINIVLLLHGKRIVLQIVNSKSYNLFSISNQYLNIFLFSYSAIF